MQVDVILFLVAKFGAPANDPLMGSASLWQAAKPASNRALINPGSSNEPIALRQRRPQNGWCVNDKRTRVS